MSLSTEDAITLFSFDQIYKKHKFHRLERKKKKRDIILTSRHQSLLMMLLHLKQLPSI